jgi:HEAT repeat protein
MGEKAATNEVINRLLLLRGDTDHTVRRGAYEALGRVGEKVATNEVIHRLVLLLGDSDFSVRSRACEVLWNMGEEATINKVFRVLLKARCENEFAMRSIEGERSRKFFDLLPCVRNLEEDIDKEKNRSHYQKCWIRENSLPEEFIRVFLHTKLSFWLPIISTT